MQAANDNLIPRGLRRTSAAAYLGISPSHFDKQRKAGAIPAPKQMFGVDLWDRTKLDALFDGAADNDNDPAFESYWDSACASGSQNT